jgi:hypothetical protein
MAKVRFVSGVPQDAALWGSSTFGGPITFGQAASDPATALVYQAIPMPEGYPDSQSWSYRIGDTTPAIELMIVSEDGAPIDSTPIAQVALALDRFTGEPHRILMPLVPVGNTFRCDPEPDDLNAEGKYRVVVRVLMNSGRVLTVPTDDRVSFTIAARSG